MITFKNHIAQFFVEYTRFKGANMCMLHMLKFFVTTLLNSTDIIVVQLNCTKLMNLDKFV